MHLDRLVEFYLAEIDAMQNGNRNWNLEGAGHGKTLISMEGNRAA